MPRKKRTFNTFNLSFLDIMSCGFGAVVLVYLIMNHAVEKQTVTLNENLLAEVDLLEREVIEGEEGLVELRNTLANLDLEIVEAQGAAARVTEQEAEWEAKISDILQRDVAESSAIESLKADLLQLETDIEELRETAVESGGRRARSFIGEGDRQYLTGLNLGGSRIVILLDRSASMLSDKLVQIIRLRNMDESLQRKAEKWQRALGTADWLTTQLPVNARYQIIAFNTQPSYALPATRGKWLKVANRGELDEAAAALRTFLPTGGTSLENAFDALGELSPPPDNIFLITDGLPTQGSSPPRGNTVSGKQRVALFREAVSSLPGRVPVNIILAPMEGDPMAASELWRLATVTRGAFLSPSRDWP